MAAIRGKPRVDWKEEEQDKLFAKVELLWAIESNRNKTLVDLVRMAQQEVLEPHRRRNTLQSFTNVPAYLREKLLKAGIGKTKDVPAAAGRPVAEDPNLQRIAALEEEKAVLVARIEDLEAIERSNQAEIMSLTIRLKAVPEDSLVVKNFFADILYLAEAKKRAIPGASDLPDVLPTHKNGNGQHKPDPELSVTSRKPKIVLVGGKPNTHAEVHREVKDFVDMRYYEAGKQGIGEALKAFKSPLHGKVLLWTRVASHQMEEGLKFHNIPFERTDATGTQALIAQIKKTAAGLGARVS
jgi:hypothetical protein